MTKKTAASILAAFLLGAGGNAAVSELTKDKVRIHSLEFVVHSDGKVHRNASGVGDPKRGVVVGTCDDGIDDKGKVTNDERQKRLQAEIVVADSECRFP